MKVLSGALLLATLTLSPLPARSMSPLAAAPQSTEEQKQQLLQLNQEVAKLANEGNYNDALEKAKKAQSLTEKVHGKQSTEYAVTFHNIANIQAALGRTVDAVELYKKAISVYEGIPNSEGRRIRVYKEMAAANRVNNNLLATRENLQQAITLSEGVTKLLNQEGVDLLFDYASVLELLRKPKDAEPVWTRGLDILNNINGGRIDLVQFPLNALKGRIKKEGYVKQEQTARGVVAVNVIVDETGKVTETSIVAGRDELNPIAVRMAKETVFNPLNFNGKSLKMAGVMVFRFPLKQAGEQQIEVPLGKYPGRP